MTIKYVLGMLLGRYFVGQAVTCRGCGSKFWNPKINSESPVACNKERNGQVLVDCVAAGREWQHALRPHGI